MIGGCSMSQNSFLQERYLHEITSACTEEITDAIEEMTGLRHIKLSDTVFQKSAMLVLTNRRRKNYPSDNPLIGVVGSEKILKLYSNDRDCRIALLDEQGNIIKKKVLQHCKCSKKEDN
jgi:hypothetical protein